MPKQADKIKIELAGTCCRLPIIPKGLFSYPVPSEHYPEIDIVVPDVKERQLVGIQVKTLKKVGDCIFDGLRFIQLFLRN